MAWNHKTRLVAIAIAIQPVAGTFTTPTNADLIAAANITNSQTDITADDPTETGAIWESENLLIGEVGMIGAMIPLRGPGGADVPAANAWVPGRILTAAGWSELRTTTAVTGTMAAGGTTTSANLAAGANATDDFYLGMPLDAAGIGAGTKSVSIITKYVGSSKTASIAETVAVALSGTYTIPKNVTYLEGPLTTASSLLSVRVWRDRKIYDYKDVRIESLQFDFPVGNEQNTVFPSLEFSGKGNVENISAGTTPTLQAQPGLLALDIPPNRNGKFAIDRVSLGHQNFRYGQAFDVAAPSNVHQPQGQDAYEMMSGSRTIELDVNQMDMGDFDPEVRRKSKTVLPIAGQWGTAPGQRFGFSTPEVQLRSLNPGDRNGFVNLTGNAVQRRVDKSAALTIWGWT